VGERRPRRPHRCGLRPGSLNELPDTASSDRSGHRPGPRVRCTCRKHVSHRGLRNRRSRFHRRWRQFHRWGFVVVFAHSLRARCDPGSRREFSRVIKPGGTLLVGFFEGPAVDKFAHAVTPTYRWPVDRSARSWNAPASTFSNRVCGELQASALKRRSALDAKMLADG
jgi:hypothetical protein